MAIKEESVSYRDTPYPGFTSMQIGRRRTSPLKYSCSIINEITINPFIQFRTLSRFHYSPGNLNTLSFPGNFPHGIKLNTVLHSPGTFPLFHSWGLFPKNGIWKLNTSSYWIRIIEHLFLTKYLCRELPLLLVEILVDWPIIGTAAGVGWPVVGEAATGWPVVVVASTIKISHYARVT